MHRENFTFYLYSSHILQLKTVWSCASPNWSAYLTMGQRTALAGQLKQDGLKCALLKGEVKRRGPPPASQWGRDAAIRTHVEKQDLRFSHRWLWRILLSSGDITSCNPLKVNRRFGGTLSPPSSGSNKPSKIPEWKQGRIKERWAEKTLPLLHTGILNTN
jgi:hypothetical protein